MQFAVLIFFVLACILAFLLLIAVRILTVPSVLLAYLHIVLLLPVLPHQLWWNCELLQLICFRLRCAS